MLRRRRRPVHNPSRRRAQYSKRISHHPGPYRHRRRRRLAYTDVQRSMDELTDYMEAMDGYMQDGRTVLAMLRDAAPYLDSETEDHMLRWLDKAVADARAFQNSMSGLVTIANNLRSAR